jgi:hypothetical protein
LLLLFISATAYASDPEPTVPRQSDQGQSAASDPHTANSTTTASSNADTREALCLMLESAAREHALPVEFFARLIWQESRFQPDAVGPTTRHGGRAEGIAQFMPGTANERDLLNPFDPIQALPKSAAFLGELRDKFGNIGLAAAAYNAGPARVQRWLDGAGELPAETRRYVEAITGIGADEWARSRNGVTVKDAPARPDCQQLMATLTQAPNLFVEKLEERVRLVAASAWGVQLAASFSRDLALRSYARLVGRFKAVLGDRDPTLLTSLLRSRGTHPLYQVRLGADTRQAADDLCARIQRAGGACMVLRNRGPQPS